MRRILVGLAAGAAGTSAMTAWQELLPRLKGTGGSGGGQTEEPAPAQAARKVLGRRYAPAQLAEDFSYHAVYGLGVAAIHDALS